MSKSIYALCLAVSVGCAAFAQSANPYVGTWHAEYENEKGNGGTGTVVITAEGGTWDMDSARRRDPCQGRSDPIAVEKATPEELVFAIKRSEALQGCQDGRASLKRVDANTLEGKFDRRFKIKLTRQ